MAPPRATSLTRRLPARPIPAWRKLSLPFQNALWTPYKRTATSREYAAASALLFAYGILLNRNNPTALVIRSLIYFGGDIIDRTLADHPQQKRHAHTALTLAVALRNPTGIGAAILGCAVADKLANFAPQQLRHGVCTAGLAVGALYGPGMVKNAVKRPWKPPPRSSQSS